jgi:hypothetical protein
MAKKAGNAPPVMRDKEFIETLKKDLVHYLDRGELKDVSPGKLLLRRRIDGQPDRYYSIEIRTVL